MFHLASPLQAGEQWRVPSLRGWVRFHGEFGPGAPVSALHGCGLPAPHGREQADAWR